MLEDAGPNLPGTSRFSGSQTVDGLSPASKQAAATMRHRTTILSPEASALLRVLIPLITTASMCFRAGNGVSIPFSSSRPKLLTQVVLGLDGDRGGSSASTESNSLALVEGLDLDQRQPQRTPGVRRRRSFIRSAPCRTTAATD
ncbi:hypothetical protein PF005_g11263 [Phytophthora fragariae]|uniref:Uncharacterized protein n=1 Tax=Phytophthora fragariae TaxID=53985 RepID=A0A6A3U0H0_9STRA|nr:hypothetical protein PF003_g35338 [Phytophthora fragariae]KAE8937650.1 hypothetical protein PF009_g12455 [Phytophthora fragariae]KAE9009453.1 hypothetical protein PF011_g10263 [Phytophthora fragariae]KAE9111526.1 hypothetical protein PF007_g11450 [Phytophthora fragariae]KAE9111612.1 hypothetical protein PF010_g10744 [Phytophthora fragariae]